MSIIFSIDRCGTKFLLFFSSQNDKLELEEKIAGRK